MAEAESRGELANVKVPNASRIPGYFKGNAPLLGICPDKVLLAAPVNRKYQSLGTVVPSASRDRNFPCAGVYGSGGRKSRM